MKEHTLKYILVETLNEVGKDADDFLRTVDLKKFSCLIIVGGDGTIHKSINGMLQREDKYSVPIGLIPNGSGNDTCRGLNILTVEKALTYILKGDLI